MYANPNARLLFQLARASVGRAPRDSETVASDTDVVESPTRTLSDESLLRHINVAQRDAAETVKAMYLPALVSAYSGALSGLSQPDMARPLRGRVERQDSDGNWQVCARRTAAEHTALEAGGRVATEESPAYVYDGGTLEVYPGSDPTVRLDYVAYPGEITLSDVPSDTWHISGGDSLSVGAALTPALAMYVTAKAQRSIGRPGMHEAYMGLYERLRRPYLRTTQIGYSEGEARRRFSELEVNTEV